jgi:Flp pilus assembly pilin Flp
MDKENALIFLIFATLLIAVVAHLVWWLPQKWQACTKLYDNIPAQVICFTGE